MRPQPSFRTRRPFNVDALLRDIDRAEDIDHRAEWDDLVAQTDGLRQHVTRVSLRFAD